MSSIVRSIFPCFYSNSVEDGDLKNQGTETDPLIAEDVTCFDCNPPTRLNEDGYKEQDLGCCCCSCSVPVDSLALNRQYRV